jgi:hypothetical protein
MAQVQSLVAHDTGSVLLFTVKDQAGVNIPDIASAKLRWRIGAGAVQESVMDVDQPNSRVSYQFQKIEGAGEDPDTYELNAGTLRAEVVIVDSQGDELTSTDVYSFPVRDRL